MSTLHPFKGFRPTKERCSKIAALPYDVMSSAEAREMVKDDPYSFLHVDRAEIDLPEDIDIYSEEVYCKAADNLNSMIKNLCFTFTALLWMAEVRQAWLDVVLLMNI